MTQDWIVYLIAQIVSILLTFVPGLKDWWEDHTKVWKARIIIMLCIGLAIVAFVLACFGVQVGSDAYCPDVANFTLLATAAIAILKIALLAAGAVQAIYQFGLKPAADWLFALGQDEDDWDEDDDIRSHFRG
jgi:amino acid transporter